jgi:hypothetical protein
MRLRLSRPAPAAPNPAGSRVPPGGTRGTPVIRRGALPAALSGATLAGPRAAILAGLCVAMFAGPLVTIPTAFLVTSLAGLFVATLQNPASAQTLPDDELQVICNGYFDSFQVNVLYPTVSVRRRVSASTSLSGSYLVDLISAASMRSRFEVEGVTSATQRGHGGEDRSPDEVRHEMSLGASHLLGPGTVAANLFYSTEADYTSKTVAASASYPFAERSTDLQIGIVRSWEEVHPRTRYWRRDKNATTLSTRVTQVLTRKLIGQLDFSYMDMSGLLSDPYQVVTIVDPDREESVNFEPRHPDHRARRALGVRANYKLTAPSSLRLGYRYYWDTWGVESNTWSGLFQQHFLGRRITVGLGIRSYQQTSAFFFRPVYTEPEKYMTVDSKLDSSHSLEYQFRLQVSGSLVSWLPGPDGDDVDLTTTASYYRRHTVTADWHSRRKILDAIITSLGYRYRF